MFSSLQLLVFRCLQPSDCFQSTREVRRIDPFKGVVFLARIRGRRSAVAESSTPTPSSPQRRVACSDVVVPITMALQSSRPSNDDLLRDLREGRAQFELVQPPALCPLASASMSRSLFFARISSPMSPAMKKLEHHSVERVTGDGRCMFRALVKGMARNKGLKLSPQQEKNDADELRMAVKEVICDSESERLQYEEALVAITCEESLKRYCRRIERPDFWGGESELLVLSKLCRQPVIVYIPEHEHAMGTRGTGFIPIAEYGSEFSKKGKPRKAVRLLYSGKNHYDLLV